MNPHTPVEWRASMTWAQRLKRVFDIDVCQACGDAMEVIACIEGPVIIKKNLDHLKQKDEATEPNHLSESRAPPAGLLLD